MAAAAAIAWPVQAHRVELHVVHVHVHNAAQREGEGLRVRQRKLVVGTLPAWQPVAALYDAAAPLHGQRLLQRRGQVLGAEPCAAVKPRV